MKCFIAIDLPEELKEYITRQSKGVERARTPSDYHLTLRFLGDLKEEKVEEVKRRLRRVEFRPFELSLGEVGYFPNKERADVVWVGVTPEEEVGDLKERIDGSLEEEIEEGKRWRFRPHVTLSRIWMLRYRDEIVKGFEDKNYEGSWRVKGFKFFQSIQENHRQIYGVLETYS